VKFDEIKFHMPFLRCKSELASAKTSDMTHGFLTICGTAALSS
jgi:hypothetical protein